MPLSYKGRLTKKSTLPGQPESFDNGESWEGVFEHLPTVGYSFSMFHTKRKTLGFVKTSGVQEILSKDEAGTIEFQTYNSTYRLEYKEDLNILPRDGRGFGPNAAT